MIMIDSCGTVHWYRHTVHYDRAAYETEKQNDQSAYVIEK